MSRTIRRKNCHLRSSYVDRPEDVDCWDLDRHQTTSPRRVVELQAARFHRDHHPGRWNAPSWYARQFNKSVARANTAEIHRCLKNDCWDDHLPVPYVSNANWNWW